MKKILCILLLLASPAHATVFLDGSTTGCTDGATTYSAATRSCGSGSDTVYTTLASFSSGITAGATNYIRQGSYFRDNAAAGQGSLYINKSGTVSNRTVVSAYPGEERQAIIGTATRGATYNSAPSDATGAGSYLYYPNFALNVAGNYVTVSGLKVYGSTYLYGSNYAVLENCDLGGAGSQIDSGTYQAQIVRLLNVTGAIIRNNYIHNGCTASTSEGWSNSSAVMSYGSSYSVEGNTFADTYAYAVRVKDGVNQAGNTVEIKNNFFGPSQFDATAAGTCGLNQNQMLSNILVHHNIFYSLNIGVEISGAPASSYLVYANTFINNTVAVQQAVTNTANPYSAYNNLSHGSGLFNKTYYLSVITASDYNLLYSAGTWQTHDAGSWTTVASSLAAWKTYSSRDANSLSTDPLFVNPAGNTAASFKRTSYAENFTGSSYGSKAGAYQTGAEVIGHSWAVTATTPTPKRRAAKTAAGIWR